jgi:DNA-binding winged helix-turn-helix (wHTH) protein
MMFAARPVLDGYGRLLYRDRWVPLSFIEERLAGPLVERFEHIVGSIELIDVGWPDDRSTRTNLSRRISRLRARLRTIGLDVVGVRTTGYVLKVREPNGVQRVAT